MPSLVRSNVPQPLLQIIKGRSLANQEDSGDTGNKETFRDQPRPARRQPSRTDTTVNYNDSSDSDDATVAKTAIKKRAKANGPAGIIGRMDDEDVNRPPDSDDSAPEALSNKTTPNKTKPLSQSRNGGGSSRKRQRMAPSDAGRSIMRRQESRTLGKAEEHNDDEIFVGWNKKATDRKPNRKQGQGYGKGSRENKKSSKEAAATKGKSAIEDAQPGFQAPPDISGFIVTPEDTPFKKPTNGVLGENKTTAASFQQVSGLSFLNDLNGSPQITSDKDDDSKRSEIMSSLDTRKHVRGDSMSSLSSVPSHLSVGSVANEADPRCPMCRKVVNKALLLKFKEKYPGQTLHYGEKEEFCKLHVRKEAKAEWKERGFPKIEWNTLDVRMKAFIPNMIRLLDHPESSFYLASYKEKLQSRAIRMVGPPTDQDAKDAVGYYGGRGVAMIGTFFSYHMREEVEKRKRENLIGERYSKDAYTRHVLVPEMATLLIMQDLSVDERRAREVMEESMELGLVLHGDTGDLSPAERERQKRRQKRAAEEDRKRERAAQREGARLARENAAAAAGRGMGSVEDSPRKTTRVRRAVKYDEEEDVQEVSPPSKRRRGGGEDSTPKKRSRAREVMDLTSGE